MILEKLRFVAPVSLIWLVTAAMTPVEADESMALAADKAFDSLVAALAGQNIMVTAAMKDAGIVRAGPVFVQNIDRSNLGLALRCGAAKGARMGLPYECMDFLVEYQFLIRPLDRTTSTLTVNATATAIDSGGLHRGLITDQSVLGILAAKMAATVRANVVGSISPAPTAVTQDSSLAPSKTGEDISAAGRPAWCRGNGYVWQAGRCLCAAPGYVWENGACSLKKTQ